MPHADLLLLSTDLQRGGTPTVVRNLAVQLSRLGVNVEVACLDGPGETGAEITAAAVPVHTLNARSPRDINAVWRLRELVRHRRYSRVFSLLLHANAAAAMVKGFVPPGTQWFQSVQTTQPNPAWHWAVQRLIAPAAAGIIVPSPSVAAALAARCDLDPSAITVIPNGVDFEALSGLPRTGGCVGFVGRLDPVKRIGDLIAAAPLLGGRPVRIWGDGPERGRLESLALAARARGSDVHLLGPIASPAEALPLCDVLVLPSLAEGFGLVLIEAMAAGVPVVATRAPGIVDVVRHGENGLLFDVGDIAGLAAAVRRLSDDSVLRQTLTADARREVRLAYDWAAIARRYIRALSLDRS